jgi:hypothetical protein
LRTVALTQLRISLGMDGRYRTSQTPPWRVFFWEPWGRVMIDSDSRAGRELKAAEEFFASAKTAPTPFMRSYYQRVAERHLTSKGELKTVERLGLSGTRAS